MSPSFPPFSDLTSLYLSPLFASGHSRPSRDASIPHGTASPTNALKNPTPDVMPPHAPTPPLTSTLQKDPSAPPAQVRRRSAASCGGHDEPPEEPLPPTATETELIQWKRRQNTLAARKSRKRKQEHLARLENTVERLTVELETWKVRALTYQAMLKNHGIQVPGFT